jgi:hypothetical protein
MQFKILKNMTKKNFIGVGTGLYLLLSISLLAGCDDGTGITDESDGRVPLQVSSNIAMRQQGPRAADNQWTQNDGIGIYMMPAGEGTILEETGNRHYKATGSGENTEFTPAGDGQAIYFPVNGEEVDFSAYYPYKPLQDDIYTIDLSDQVDQETIDLMTAIEANYSKATPEVFFQFKRRLSKIVLSVAAGTGIADADLENLKVEISGQHTAGTYEPLSRDFDILQENPEIIVLKTTTDGTDAEAILMPNDVGGNDPVEGRRLIFTLENTGDVFRWDIPGDKYFNQGEKNMYRITINRTGLEVTSSITDWVIGNGDGEDGSAE